jgi:hypothetical protein
MVCRAASAIARAKLDYATGVSTLIHRRRTTPTRGSAPKSHRAVAAVAAAVAVAVRRSRHSSSAIVVRRRRRLLAWRSIWRVRIPIRASITIITRRKRNIIITTTKMRQRRRRILTDTSMLCIVGQFRSEEAATNTARTLLWTCRTSVLAVAVEAAAPTVWS